MSSLFQMAIGFTGLMGFLLRFIGPLTVAPTITLVGLALFEVAAEQAGEGMVEPSWIIKMSFLVCAFLSAPRNASSQFDCSICFFFLRRYSLGYFSHVGAFAVI